MPHPERASDPTIKATDGKFLFAGLLGLVNAIA
jgi:phosphoribosylformylglycinamidine (FGAM) synthase-like amidotransferase family enzyme